MMLSKDWEFRLKDESAWYWRVIDRVNGNVEQAHNEFPTLYACVKDAEAHGYHVPCQREAWYGTV